LLFTCNYCGDHFCTEHRLPENHACNGLIKWKTKSPPRKSNLIESRKEYPTSISYRRAKSRDVGIVLIIITVLVLLFSLLFL
jgi:hypothetical protein